jgi:ectoine hydroxylase
MKLTNAQVEKYKADGYLLIESVFDDIEIKMILAEMMKLIAEDSPRRILEKSGSVRSFFAPEMTNDIFFRVTRSQRMIESCKELLGAEIYIHQSKVNTKHAFVGDWWQWHQDFTYWKLEDGMQKPDVVTAMIFLNNVNEFNGPLFLIPGSHMAGIMDEDENEPVSIHGKNNWFETYQASTTYMSALTADLKYTLKQNTIAYWATKNGIVSAKGPAGSVLFFHGNIFHSSSNNLSPWDRHMFLITYNSINNILAGVENPRPEFISNRNYTPVVSLPEERLSVQYPITEMAK